MNEKEYFKKYAKTERGKMTIKIKDWRRRGLVCNDYYEYATIF